MNKVPSQEEQVLSYLKAGNMISPIEALNLFGCFRLSARIYNLRHGKHDGVHYEIEEVAHDGKQYAIYKLKV